METATQKQWHSRFHTHGKHSMAVRLDHMIHDERFWPIIIALALIVAFIALALWVGLAGETNKDVFPVYPFYP